VHSAGVIRLVLLFVTLLGMWFIMKTYFHHTWKAVSLRSWLGEARLPRHKCGNQKSCPQNYFAFKIISGAANVVGPSICFEDLVLMSSVKNNIGRGLNIALVNGDQGSFLPQESFPRPLHTPPSDTFLPSFRMNDKVRAYFTELGSSHVGELGFRDNWVFLGAKGLMNKSPFEKHIKNDQETNKYEGWPELLEMEGCAPRKMD
uniref:FAM3 metabolism regulating signaling molecule D n=1 Tax=Malurus cyaneus samueli TaxID=2593467 RepID=A0A8C5TKZ9_9PASS